MTASKLGDQLTEEFWRDFLIKGDPRERAGRRIFSKLPLARAVGCAPRRSPGQARP